MDQVLARSAFRLELVSLLVHSGKQTTALREFRAASRSTRNAPGHELWLRDFGIIARVHTRALPWGEFVYGETHFAITEPLHIIVEILFLQSAQQDLAVWGEGAFGEFFYTEPKPLFTEKEILDLIRFVQPHSQEITVIWRVGEAWETDDEVWNIIQW